MLRSIVSALLATAFSFTAQAQCVSCDITVGADCVAPGERLEVEVCVINSCDRPVEILASLIAHALEGEEFVIEETALLLPPIEKCKTYNLRVPEDIVRGGYDLEVTIVEGDHTSTCGAAVTVSDDC